MLAVNFCEWEEGPTPGLFCLFPQVVVAHSYKKSSQTNKWLLGGHMLAGFPQCDHMGDSLLRLVLKKKRPRLETFI